MILALHVPAGTPALDVAHYGDRRLHYQRELLLPAGLEVAVTGRGLGAEFSTHPGLADTMVVKALVSHD